MTELYKMEMWNSNMCSHVYIISKGNNNTYCHGISWDTSSFSFQLCTSQCYCGNMYFVLNVFFQFANFMFTLDAQNHIFNQNSHGNHGCHSQKASSSFSQKGTCAYRTHSNWKQFLLNRLSVDCVNIPGLN